MRRSQGYESLNVTAGQAAQKFTQFALNFTPTVTAGQAAQKLNHHEPSRSQSVTAGQAAQKSSNDAC